MDLFEAINNRCSIRKFEGTPVPREDIEKMLATAIRAPSGANSQPWRFVVIENKALLANLRKAVEDKLAEITTWDEAKGLESKVEAYARYFTFFDQAPVVITVFGCEAPSVISSIMAAHGQPRKINSAKQSCGAAIQNLLLAAEALGYGACWMTGPTIADKAIEKLVGVGEEWFLVALIPIGKPKENPHSRSRKELSEVVEYR
ncbi:MAG: nitroreductase family protein [Actinobacteria bacterium]|nr:nitroreductase family protein [Actinomycetota bacterium]